jgi:FkbM family methyltransferase
MTEAELGSVLNTAGHTLWFDPGDRRGRALAKANGDLNPESLQLWRAALALNSWDVALDIGSNYGEMLAGADLSSCRRVVAFEPNSSVLPALRKTVADLPHVVELREVAVGAVAGTTVTFSRDPEWSGKSHVGPSPVPAATEEVPSTSVDAELETSHPDAVVMKIDVEGHESEVLEGTAGTLSSANVVVIMLEILHMPVQDLWDLTRRFPLVLKRTGTEELVRIEVDGPEELGTLLHERAFHRENALIVGGREATAFLDQSKISSTRTPKRAVYTALFGNYEGLQEQPAAASSTVPFICFTDDPDLTSETWEVRLAAPRFPLDSIRSARSVKILGHPDLADFTETLWIDNRVELTADPGAVLDSWLRDADVALFEHSFRETVLDEFTAVVDGGYDDPSRVYEQLIHYAESDPDVLEERPLWTGMIARRSTSAVRAAMASWSDHVMRYSRRDQLSISQTIRGHHLRVTRLVSDNRESEWHQWPPVSPNLQRRTDLPAAKFQNAILAPLAKLKRLETPALLRASSLEKELAEREAMISGLRAERDDAIELAGQRRRQSGRTRRDAERLTEALTEAAANLDDARRQLEQVREENAARRRQAQRLEGEIRRLNAELAQPIARRAMQRVRAALKGSQGPSARED